MGRKKVLEKRRQRLLEKKNELLERSKASEDIAELRSINEKLEEVKEDLEEVEEELSLLDEETKETEAKEPEPKEPEPTRQEGRSLIHGDIVGAFGQRRGIQNEPEEQRADSYLGTLEYRQAFADFVRTGEWNYRAESDGMVITSDVGKIIPQTIMNEFVKELKVYGNLYNRVRKLNIRGGVEFPIEELVPTVTWIGETTVSDTQAAPEIKKTIAFGYHTCEARISQSLLSSVVTLSVLESEIARLLAEAFIKEFDRVIISGSGSGQPLGILNDTRVTEKQKITMSESEMADWTSWRTKLFAKIPLAYRGGGVLVMTANTWESQIMTMRDANNRPIYQETYNPVTGQTECRFLGREVQLVEPDILKDFDTATEDEAFGLYFKPTDYAINSNLQIGFKRYFNEDTNKWVNKGLCIIDGKLIDVHSVYILKKGSDDVNPEG